jgi:GTP-binding protein
LITLDATFVTSAASAGDVPAGCRPQIALVGRSNVGKSSLINALTRTKVARTSAAPGKTRLANVYRIGTGRRDSGLGTRDSKLLVRDQREKRIS